MNLFLDICVVVVVNLDVLVVEGVLLEGFDFKNVVVELF